MYEIKIIDNDETVEIYKARNNIKLRRPKEFVGGYSKEINPYNAFPFGCITTS